MTDLIAICDTCGVPVADGQGWLGVDRTEIYEHQHLAAEWHQRHGAAAGLSDMLGYPEPARWRLLHEGCPPHLGEFTYQIPVGRLRSWWQLTDWTAHLMDNDWLTATDWPLLLRNAARGIGDRLVRADRVGRAA